MSDTIYVVKYSGAFGFIKPWTAVRDNETFSQQFLTPSMIEGIEKKLFPELLNTQGVHKIISYRLNYKGLDIQQERTWSKGGIKITKESGVYKTNQGIINRGVMLEPHLYLAFKSKGDAEVAFKQTICLARNEDLLFPTEWLELSKSEFDEIEGFELKITTEEKGFKVGFNRFNNAEPMYGELIVIGNPIRNDE